MNKISFKKPSLFLSVRTKLLWFFLFVFSLLKNTVLITSFTEQGFWVMSISSFRWLDHRFYGNFCFEAKALSITIKVRLLARTDSNKIEVTGSQLALFISFSWPQNVATVQFWPSSLIQESFCISYDFDASFFKCHVIIRSCFVEKLPKIAWPGHLTRKSSIHQTPKA